ncbi:PDR/VanB family oxidoreductase [Nocardia huaxiensis]|uniref:PDR/VanB family oxidoreductase n=1 Tax=Nocardia huaxiensis TaxID=2755382 RepID=UPI001E62A6F5|nr:PDR/VanB family oxidoreductase [Nocardia huaxiensis]UFS98537.1 PDR/VanB family oxidoreductase [Nocardia huaxiensis]
MVELIRGNSPLAPEPERLYSSLRVSAKVFGAYKHLVAASRLAARLSAPNPVRYTGFDLNLHIDSITTEAQDVVSLTFTAPDGAELPRWVPGSHLDLFLPSGRQRQYSLCGDPQDRHRYRIAVRHIHDGGGGSKEIHESLAVGDMVHIRGPRNAFRLADADSYLFIAGGIGITPILPMAQAAHRAGKPWRMVYLGRTRASLPFLDELAKLTAGQLDIRTDDEHGIPDMTEILREVPETEAVYLCGPTSLLTAAHRLMPGGSRAELHTERFSPPPVAGGEPFRIELERSGCAVEVGADESALSAIRRVKPDIGYSCQQGYCGTCMVKVSSGEVEHRDTKLLDTERAAGGMLICVSRAKGRLTLDL